LLAVACSSLPCLSGMLLAVWLVAGCGLLLAGLLLVAFAVEAFSPFFGMFGWSAGSDLLFV